eukprot:NODE_848_length_1413_cov_53.873900_g705_i0.p2 GENE.NODE_848_length_1413_cov_53.873900_g705_i0~~NODE_848_length_1413_cov_53.873900_g705_i0.p2  ORF type:complete len:144 (-),score=19.36 NODE_848_length_1413_cov_53.873900_g705_i0:104-535(-)
MPLSPSIIFPTPQLLVKQEEEEETIASWAEGILKEEDPHASELVPKPDMSWDQQKQNYRGAPVLVLKADDPPTSPSPARDPAPAQSQAPEPSTSTFPTNSQVEGRCNHPKQWKRLRAKRGRAFFVCFECGAKWQTRSANCTEE